MGNGNRNEWSPIRSVIILRGRPTCLFKLSMITDRIGRHEVLLSIKHKNYQAMKVMKERENLH